MTHMDYATIMPWSTHQILAERDKLHGPWLGEFVRHLSTKLPAGFRTAPRIHLASPFEVHIESYPLDSRVDPMPNKGRPATLARLAPTLTVDADYCLSRMNIKYESTMPNEAERLSRRSKSWAQRIRMCRVRPNGRC